MLRIDVSALDYAIIGVYFVTVLGVGIARAAPDQDGPRLLPLGPVVAGVDHGPRVHRRQPRRARDPRHGRERRPVRRGDRALLLARRHPRDGVPGHRDDALLLRLEGALGAGVPEAPLRQRGAPLQRALVRGRHGADQRREPVCARPRAVADAWLVNQRGDRGRGRHRAHLHHARRPLVRDLQRGHPVLHHRRGARRARVRRAASTWAGSRGWPIA